MRRFKPAENPVQPGDGDSRHGSYSTYVNHRCRCELCRRAWTEYCQRRKGERELKSDDPRHGNYATYINYSCRCELCRSANTARARRVRARAAA
jgi:hypothetical protein